MKALFGFPGAGEGPNAFRHWKEHLKEEICFQPVLYNRAGAGAYCRNMAEAAERSVREILPSAQQGAELYLFGHSMGAVVAYETASLLEREYSIHLRALFVSAFTSPDVPIEEGIADLGDEALAAEICSHGNVPEEFLRRPALLKLFLPKIRADYRLIEEYRDSLHHVLDCPIIGFFGQQDELVTPETSEGWADYTTGSFFRCYFPGNHYYYYDHPEEITEEIRRWIRKFSLEQG